MKQSGKRSRDLVQQRKKKKEEDCKIARRNMNVIH